MTAPRRNEIATLDLTPRLQFGLDYVQARLAAEARKSQSAVGKTDRRPLEQEEPRQ